MYITFNSWTADQVVGPADVPAYGQAKAWAPAEDNGLDGTVFTRGYFRFGLFQF